MSQATPATSRPTSLRTSVCTSGSGSRSRTKGNCSACRTGSCGGRRPGVHSGRSKGGLMKKLVIGLGMFVLVVAVLRRLGPRLAEQAIQKCQEMFADRSLEGRRSDRKEPDPGSGSRR